ncbi:hypothetical protein HOG17_03625 [Candidatus Peregrinibacteria bacterium]|jgi:hypothetical protein|nr:hypothetical protein [Candidatus Peregrinibacteria bacterium]MBT4148293.1 hypothetical protein [Candidatus Peregrinibacteria bacterium]MBT4366430.1 hypothetical protein [Candidatus Peregrinibacteria bacterium]MBT4456196.1 hypothetical protein [Candidatus Peregrinibacteria bacterium]
MSKYKIFLLGTLLLIGLGMLVVLPKATNYLEIQRVENQNEDTISEIKEFLNTPIAKPVLEPQKPITIQEEKLLLLPTSAYLEVEFICQAPLQTEANWQYHEESCEEVAVLQSYLYMTGQTMTRQEAHEEVLKMIDWQMAEFGGHHDIYADKVKEFIEGYYDVEDSDIEIVYDATLEDVRSYIAEGFPVIVPIMGNILKNPYYPHPGYHMLVAIGYTEDMIVTNDNGTRKGADFSYENQVFQDAMNAAGGDIVIIKTKTTKSSH